DLLQGVAPGDQHGLGLPFKVIALLACSGLQVLLIARRHQQRDAYTPHVPTKAVYGTRKLVLPVHDLRLLEVLRKKPCSHAAHNDDRQHERGQDQHEYGTDLGIGKAEATAPKARFTLVYSQRRLLRTWHDREPV